MATKKLTAQEQLFVLYYLGCLDAKKAALKAKYAKTTAHVKAYAWVSQSSCPKNKRHVYNAIQKALKEKTTKLDVSADRISEELAIMAFSNLSDYLTIHDDGSVTMKTFEQMPKGASRAIEMVEDIRKILGTGKGGEGDGIILDARLKYKLGSKIKALELLGKVHGMFVDKTVIVDESDIVERLQKGRERAKERNK